MRAQITHLIFLLSHTPEFFSKTIQKTYPLSFMWLGNYLWKESESHFRQIISPGEFDWRKHCGVDRIIEFNRTYSEKSSV